MRILSTLNRELLKPSSSVALHRHSNALVDVLPPEADSSISLLGDNERPDVKYSDIGGYDIQKQEIREAVELPLTQGDLYRQIGIDPPRGVLLYGPPGAFSLVRGRWLGGLVVVVCCVGCDVCCVARGRGEGGGAWGFVWIVQAAPFFRRSVCRCVSTSFTTTLWSWGSTTTPDKGTSGRRGRRRVWGGCFCAVFPV